MSIAMGRFLLVSCANMFNDVALRGELLTAVQQLYLGPSLLNEVLGTACTSDGNHIGYCIVLLCNHCAIHFV